MNRIKEKYKLMPIQIKASFWFFICLILQKSISIVTTPIFTRILTTSDYGKFNVFNSWENILSIIISLNLSLGVFNQGLIKYEKDRLNFTSSLQGLSFTLVLFWTIIYFFFRVQINKLLDLSTEYMLLMILTIWLNSIFQFWASEEKVNYKYKKIIFITLSYSILSPVLGIVLMQVMEDKVLARILGITITSFILYVGLFIKKVIEGKKFFSKFYWEKALSFNIPLIPHYLSQTILNSSDRIMIEKMIDSSASGIYSLAYSLSLLMTIVNNALMQTISPWIYKKIREKKIKDIEKIAVSSLIIVGLADIFFIFLAPEAVAIFAPKDYYNAIYIIPPVAMSVFFMYMYDLFAKFEFYFEKTKIISLATMLGAVTNIVLNYFSIKKIGYIAAGYTTLICYIIYAFFHYCAMKVVCKKSLNKVYPYNGKRILAISCLFLMIGFSCLFLYNHTIIRYTILFITLILGIIRRKTLYNNIKVVLQKKID